METKKAPCNRQSERKGQPTHTHYNKSDQNVYIGRKVVIDATFLTIDFELERVVYNGYFMGFGVGSDGETRAIVELENGSVRMFYLYEMTFVDRKGEKR